MESKIDLTILEEMNVSQLSELMVQVSAILNRKLNEPATSIEDEVEIRETKSECVLEDSHEITTTLSESPETSVESETFDLSISVEGHDLEMINSKSKIMSPLSNTRELEQGIIQVGTIKDPTEKSPNHQSYRIFDIYGICPTITKTVAPYIFIYNNQVDKEEDTPVKPETPDSNPLW